MSKVKASYEKAELDALFADAAPPTDEDVSVTNDGRRLDSAEAVMAFFEEMKAERAVAARLHGASRLTFDLDVLARLENLDCVAAVLRELGAFLCVGGLDGETARSLPFTSTVAH